MQASDIAAIFDNKAVWGALSFLAGALVSNLIAVLRNRLRVLDYTVTHDRVGLPSDDPVFTDVKISWQGHSLTNLYSSVVTVSNATLQDFTGLEFRLYAGGPTVLLSESTELSGSTYIIKWSDSFAKELKVSQGQEPTAAQYRKYHSGREYKVPTLNRGQTAVFRFLTTVPTGNEGPRIWVDLLHPGVKAVFRPAAPVVHGVPMQFAAAIGLIACLVVLVAAALGIENRWLLAGICTLVGLFAQSVGAGLYMLLRYLKYLVVR